MAFHSTQGPQLGLPQMIQSRPQFGYVGALLVWGVALIAYIGYNAFNQNLAGQTLHSLYGFDEAPTSGDIRGARPVARHPRLRSHPHRPALARVSADRRAADFLRCGARPGTLFRATVRAPRFQRRAVSRAVLRVRGLPGLVVHLRVGLFALLAAQRGRRRLVLVDVSRGIRRRRVDHAGRHRGRRAVPEARIRNGAAHRGRRRGTGLRQAALALLPRRTRHHHHAQLLRRIADAAVAWSTRSSPDARRSRGASSP